MALGRKKKGGSGMTPFKAGAIAAALIIVFSFFGFTRYNPLSRPFKVQATFQSANGLQPRSPVRIAGVDVGKVKKVESIGAGRGARVTMEIQARGLPVFRDAQLKVRPRIFLEGNFFVDLQPGSPGSRRLESGATVPVNQTSAPVQFGDVLTSLQSNTRDDLKSLLREYSKGLKGRGARGFNRSIRYWKPAYRDSALVSDALLGERPGDLAGYIANAGATAAALDRNGEQLKSLVSDFNTTARAFAREDDALRGAVRELPRTLRAAQPALGQLNAAFPNLRAFARDLRPGVRSSGPTIDAARPLVAELRGLVSEPELQGLAADLRPSVGSLARLGARAIPFQRSGRRLASCQNEVVLPWGRDKVGDPVSPANSPVHQEFAKVLPGLAGESRSGDANGQWFRVLLSGGTNLVNFGPGKLAVTTLPLNGTNPPKPPTRPPLRKDVACETQEPPDLASEPGAAPPQRQVDTSDPAYRERLALARRRAIRWLEGQLEREGLDGKLRVADEDATEGLLDQVAARAGRAQQEQLARVREGLGRTP